MLLNDFFTIKEESGNEQERVYRLALSAEHPIYQAHFQGNPITPGACIVQMVKELSEHTFSTSCLIRSIKNVKFLCVINPLEHQAIDVHLTVRATENNMLSVSAVIDREKAVFSKLNLVLETTGIVQKPILQDRMDKLNLCMVIPTYNNEKTLVQAISDVLQYTHSVIVVNDGSTDSTREILDGFAGKIELVSYQKNRGKGHALKCGFDRAEALGYKSVISYDSDGQHDANDIEKLVRLAESYPGAYLIGQRIITGKIPSGNNFANKFSNFWFAVQTGKKLRDTQNGIRLYPLTAMKGMRPFSTRFEAELEMLVRCAWKGIPILPVPVYMYYAPEGVRVTHFRPARDFLRISLLNTLLTFLAILYGYPSMLCRKLFKTYFR